MYRFIINIADFLVKGVKIIVTGYSVANSEIKNSRKYPQSSLQSCFKQGRHLIKLKD